MIFRTRTPIAFLLPLLALLLPGIAAGPLCAQPGVPENLAEYTSYGDNYFLEIATLPGPASSRGRALVTFRLSYDLLTFRRTTQAYRKGGLYVATPTLFVEAAGPDGVIVDRASWRDTARVQEYARTNSKTDFLCGSVELALRPGLYTVKYTLDDGTPGSGFTQTTAPFAMDDFNSVSPAIGMPIFIRRAVGDSLVLTAIDGAAMFGRRLRAFIPLSSPVVPENLRFEVSTVPKKGEAARTVRTGDGTMLGPMVVERPLMSGNDIVYLTRRTDTGRVYGALIDASTDDMDVGDYTLALTYRAGQNSVTDTSRFRIRWVEMPFTLSKPEYAIRALFPIATDETIDEMLSGGRDAQRRAIDAFWAPRDPTPATRYNEAMAEYYRRADYSYFNFRGIGQNDGVFTDRGKIYLLYGPPAEVTRDMQPNTAPREVWIYRQGVRRRFVFVDDGRNGDYRLVEYNDL
ncbi:MAG TPA: GWxTD domain-containing protein [Candidatus Kapabacteria bacterium]|nr:GWxTD domain-containing protein [Candidatus Kapabacteria bacterium]